MSRGVRVQTRLGSGVAVALAATALIRPLAWKPPYAVGTAPKSKKKKKKNWLFLEEVRVVFL